MLRRVLLAAAMAVAVPAFAAAQPFVEHLEPPVVERGKTSRVTVVGSKLANAEAVWFSVPGLTAKPIESSPGRAVFEVTAAADAPVGTAGLRIATRDGLGNAVLFLVDGLPLWDRKGAAPDSFAAWGTFGEAAVDRFPIVVRAGETVSFEAVANRLGRDADPLLTIRDANGKFVAERDNDPGLYFDFRFAHTFATAGTYTLELRDARFKASEHHKYVLRVGKFPAARVGLPTTDGKLFLPELGTTAVLEPGIGERFVSCKRPGDIGSAWVPVLPSDGPMTLARPFDANRTAALEQSANPVTTFAFHLSPFRGNPFLALERNFATGRFQPTPAAIPGTLVGTIAPSSPGTAFAFRMDKGQKIYVRGQAQSLNSPADLELAIVDKTGREQRRANAERGEVSFDFAAGSPGEYGLVARDLQRDGGPSFAFQATVRSEPFPPKLAADVEGLTVPQGSFQPVPISVARSGTAGPIALKLVDAPPGLTLSPTEIDEKSTALVCRLTAAADAPLGVHTVRIVAEGTFGKVPIRTLPLIDRRYFNVDLIPIAFREDQTRLPPSLTDRFAVQVTPPSPFTFELPDALVTLPRYQKAAIPAVTTRVAGFDGPIAFAVKGGQLGDKAEGRTRVYAEFPPATAAQPKVSGTAVSKILSNLAKARIDVTATGTHAGRTVNLTRTFDLDLRAAFSVAGEPKSIALLPGDSRKVRLTVDRLNSFAGPVKLRLAPQSGLEFPETATIPAGETGVEIEVTVAPDAAPRKVGIPVTATGVVDGFEEEVRAPVVEVEVMKKK